MYVATMKNGQEMLFRPSMVDSESYQRVLVECRGRPDALHCMCSGRLPGARLYIRVGNNGKLHPCRHPDTAADHAPGCMHSAQRDLSESFGAPTGAMKMQNGQLLVDLDRLFNNSAPMQDGSGGQWKPSSSDHTPQLLALLWLMLVRSGLHVSYPDAASAGAWKDLQSGIASINTVGHGSAGSLAHLTLMPANTDRDTLQHNRQKITSAAKSKKPLLVLTSLRGQSVLDVARKLELWDSLKVRAFIWQDAIRTSAVRFCDARAHCARGEETLLLGLATVQHRAGQKYPEAKVRSFALLGVSSSLNPLPTLRHTAHFKASYSSRTAYATRAHEDPVLNVR